MQVTFCSYSPWWWICFFCEVQSLGYQIYPTHEPLIINISWKFGVNPFMGLSCGTGYGYDLTFMALKESTHFTQLGSWELKCIERLQWVHQLLLPGINSSLHLNHSQSWFLKRAEKVCKLLQFWSTFSVKQFKMNSKFKYLKGGYLPCLLFFK